MNQRTFFLGSPATLTGLFAPNSPLVLPSGADVCVLPTAAAFTGATETAVATSARVQDADVRVEALMVTDRSSASEPYFAERLAAADAIILTDGSALHARSTWRETPVGEALRDAALVMVIGETCTVLGDHMADPRGGAPTTGLGYRSGAVVVGPCHPDRLARTSELLGDNELVIALNEGGVVLCVDGEWRALNDEVRVFRGGAADEINSR